MESIDEMIESANLLRKLVRNTRGFLERFEDQAINGPYLLRPVYADEFRKVAKHATEVEELCLEATRYFVREIQLANKTPSRFNLSAVQLNQLVNFLEMMHRPLFPILANAQYRHPGFNAELPRPDC